VPGAPFEVLRVVSLPRWREVALWWPDSRTLVVADALGTAPYFLGPGERLAVHPLLRLLPPSSLAGLDPEHVLCGHGEGVHGSEASEALDHALRRSRRGIPRWLVGLARNRGRSS
jgi:glyoxylase-like metal-dependent hydrolase (beta-lactamase superfamily II)